ncbi:MAG: LPS export ABC transporter periplasmic protein LptC [Bacteroidetes bacterium]|jgi:LPS export ABC transporter protein LptC|nr:LPS export ABC transporter periplasmic protein LptC [Bacteroidota bacterium]
MPQLRSATRCESRSPFRGWAVFAFALVSALAFEGCGTTVETGVQDDRHEDQRLPAQVVEGGYFEYTEKGKVVQSLEAARLERWEQKTSGSEPELDPLWQVDEGFTLYIGGTKSQHTARLSAVRGTYDDQKGRLEAWEEVVLVNEAGDMLLTEHLIWSHDSDLVRTQRPVEIRTAQGVLRGRGLNADSHFERYEILAPTGSFELGMTNNGSATEDLE